jgi:hypothetical protein
VLSCGIVDEWREDGSRFRANNPPKVAAKPAGTRFASLTPVAKMSTIEKVGLLMAGVGPDSSAFAMVWTHTSRLSPLRYEGKAATICQESRLVESAFLVLGNRPRRCNRLVFAMGVGKDRALSHNASCR